MVRVARGVAPLLLRRPAAPLGGLRWRPARGAALLAAGGALVGPAWSHGGAAPVSPFGAGARALAGEPACVLALLALALLVAQQGWPRARAAVLAGAAALAAAALLAAFGIAGDFTLELLTLTLACGGLVAWARPLPSSVHAALGASVAAAAMLVSMPAQTADLSFRLVWLAGVVIAAIGLSGNALLLLQALVGRTRGRIKTMLVRVAGSWLATAAVLVLALEWTRRSV